MSDSDSDSLHSCEETSNLNENKSTPYEPNNNTLKVKRESELSSGDENFAESDLMHLEMPRSTKVMKIESSELNTLNIQDSLNVESLDDGISDKDIIDGISDSDIVENIAEHKYLDDPDADGHKILNLEGVTVSETSDFVDRHNYYNKEYSRNSSMSDSDVINSFMQSSSDEAEARLWAKRQARAEAREIRMRELERQQKEQEENADRQFDMMASVDTPPVAALVRTPRSTVASTTGRYHLSSRRSSEDSLEDCGSSLREMRHELKEVEEKFRKAMIANAQLDNDKASQTYQLELLKDRLEELEEEHSQLKREHRDKCREHEQLKRLCAQLKDELAAIKYELAERDRLIEEKGLVVVTCEDETENGAPPRKALVSAENARLLDTAGDGSLDVRLERFAKEKSDLQDQISHLKLELEEERSRRRKSSSLSNGPLSEYDLDDVQREASKQLADYKFRAQKAEQDVATLQATVARLESQVIRYKTASEISEQSEEALKSEKRKLQREAREAQTRAEELETSNTHLLKRLDKLKNAKSALLKEL